MSCNPIYPDEPIQLMGAVFCGGKSTRMGEDKGLKKKEGKTWADIAASKLEAFHFPFCVSIRKEQLGAYSQVFDVERLVIDKFAIEGPLEGLLSTHNAYPDHDLLIIACDLVDVQASLIQKLLDEFRQREGEHDFFVFENKGQLEPLLGLYTREGLQKLFDLYALNQLEKFSMKHILEIGNTYAIPLAEPETKQFANYNTPHEL